MAASVVATPGQDVFASMEDDVSRPQGANVSPATPADVDLEHGAANKNQDFTGCDSETSAGESGDLSMDTTSTLEAADVTVGSKDWFTRRTRGCLCCCGVSLVVCSALAFFLFPRRPHWEILDCSFDASIIDNLTDAFYDEEWNGTVELPLQAKVQIWNNAWIGAEVGETHFEVMVGGAVVSHAVTNGTVVKPRSHWTAVSESLTVISKENIGHMRAEITEDFTFRTWPRVRGKVPAKVFGLFTLPVIIDCTVEVVLTDLVADPPGKIVHDHKCTYSLDM